MSKFPKEIEDFGNVFQELQVSRHAADYDPSSSFTKTEVVEAIKAAESAIKAFSSSSIKDRRAFAAWTAMQVRND